MACSLAYASRLQFFNRPLCSCDLQYIEFAPLAHEMTDPHQTTNLANQTALQTVISEHRHHLEQWEAKTDDKGRYPESKDSLRLGFKSSKEDV